MQFLKHLLRAVTEINFVLMLAVFLFLASLALNRAQAQQPGTAPVKAEAIIVSASRSDTRIEDMPLHTTIVSQEDIRKSPAQTLDQLLRSVPGLNFTGIPAMQSDPTGHQTRMRGLGNAKVLMLLDGVPIHDPFYLTTQFFKVPLSNIERIEVVRGGNSSLWGNMAVAGVINIVSRRVKDDSGEAAASIGSRGTAGISLVKNFALSEAFGINIAIDEQSWKGYQVTPVEQQWRTPQKSPVDARNTNVQVTAFFKPSTDLNGYLRVGHHIQDQDISYQYGTNLQKNPDVSGGFTWKPDEASSVQGNAWAQYVNFEKYNGATCYFNGGLAPASRCKSSATVTPADINNNVLQYYTQYGSQRYREQGGSAIWSRNMKGLWNNIQVGADYRRLTATDLEFFYGAPTAQAAPQGNLGSSTYGKGKQEFSGLFVQTRIAPVEPLEITLSGRYDTFESSDRLNTRTTAAGVTTGGPIADAKKTAFNPSLALRYSLTDALSLRGATYKSFRAPGFNNTTRTFGATTPTIANPNLDIEQLRGIEAGVDYDIGNVNLAATLFQYDIRNQIATFRVNNFASAPAVVRTICSNGGANLANCGGSANYYTNDQDGRSRGLELAGTWRVSDTLWINGTYTRTDSYLVRRGAVVTDPLNVQLAGLPKNIATTGVSWTPHEKWKTYTEMRFVGRMNIDTTSTPGLAYAQGASTVFNASATYSIERDTDVMASVVNLLNKEYSENAYTFNQPFNRNLSMPRTWNVALRTRF